MPRGGARPGSGRKPGKKSPETIEGERLARSLVEDKDYVKALKQRLLKGEVAPIVEKHLLEMAYGKVPERREITGADGGPLDMRLRDIQQQSDAQLLQLLQLVD